MNMYRMYQSCVVSGKGCQEQFVDILTRLELQKILKATNATIGLDEDKLKIDLLTFFSRFNSHSENRN